MTCSKYPCLSVTDRLQPHRADNFPRTQKEKAPSIHVAHPKSRTNHHGCIEGGGESLCLEHRHVYLPSHIQRNVWPYYLAGLATWFAGNQWASYNGESPASSCTAHCVSIRMGNICASATPVLPGWLARVSITCSCPGGLSYRRIALLSLILPGKPSLISGDPVQSKKSREGGKGDRYPGMQMVRGGMGKEGPSCRALGLDGVGWGYSGRRPYLANVICQTPEILSLASAAASPSPPLLSLS